MKVSDIVKLTALMTGKSDVIDYLNGGEGQAHTLETLSTMVDLCNLVINELACTYIPITRKEITSFVYGRFSFNTLREKVIRVVAVYDADGKEVEFSHDNDNIYANIQKGSVEYEYSPSNYGLDSVIGYTEMKISARVIAYGVSAEYCINQGLFEQAVMFHKRYVDALAEICVPKNVSIKKRSFR